MCRIRSSDSLSSTCRVDFDQVPKSLHTWIMIGLHTRLSPPASDRPVHLQALPTDSGLPLIAASAGAGAGTAPYAVTRSAPFCTEDPVQHFAISGFLSVSYGEPPCLPAMWHCVASIWRRGSAREQLQRSALAYQVLPRMNASPYSNGEASVVIVFQPVAAHTTFEIFGCVSVA